MKQEQVQVQQVSVAKDGLYISEIEGKGRAVFAARDFKAGEVIEVCPVIVLSNNERKRINYTELRKYYYEWGPDFKEAAIILGFGSVYNHDYDSNAHYERDTLNRTLRYVCVKDIKAGEEITVNYNGEIMDETPVWFDKDKIKQLFFNKKD